MSVIIGRVIIERKAYPLLRMDRLYTVNVSCKKSPSKFRMKIR